MPVKKASIYPNGWVALIQRSQPLATTACAAESENGSSRFFSPEQEALLENLESAPLKLRTARPRSSDRRRKSSGDPVAQLRSPVRDKLLLMLDALSNGWPLPLDLFVQFESIVRIAIERPQEYAERAGLVLTGRPRAALAGSHDYPRAACVRDIAWAGLGKQKPWPRTKRKTDVEQWRDGRHESGRLPQTLWEAAAAEWSKVDRTATPNEMRGAFDRDQSLNPRPMPLVPRKGDGDKSR